MSSSRRSNFLARVAAAVRAGQRHREGTHREVPASVGYLGAGDDPIGRLVDELRAVGACAYRVQTPEELRAVLANLVARFAVRRAACNTAGAVLQLGVPETLRAAGVEVTTPDTLAARDEPTRRDRAFSADLGVAAPDWAIAETGTLVYASGPEQTRSATLLPPVHLAIVDRSRVLADLLDLPAKIEGQSVDGALPRNVALVTGPSKTGDIELRLTTGVHGPGEVHALIWEGV